MKAVVIRRYGSNEVVHLEDLPVPLPGPGDLLVKVHAASVNPLDFKIRQGQTRLILRYRFPLVLGNDLSGVVAEAGPGATRFRPGDAVYARLDKDRIGAFAEFALVRERAAAPKPATLGHVEAAAVPLAGLTAWQALRDIGKLQAGHKVLIHAGSGGVGTLAIQLARHLGATVATTVGARNAELVKRLGADIVIDYQTTRFEDVVRDFDLVFDTQGGDTLKRSFQVVRRGGTVVTVGGLPDAEFAREWGLSPVLGLALRFLNRKITRLALQRDVRFKYLFMRADGGQLAEIGALIDHGQGVLRPVIDRVLPLDQAKEALAYVESGRAVGKVVIEVP